MNLKYAVSGLLLFAVMLGVVISSAIAYRRAHSPAPVYMTDEQLATAQREQDSDEPQIPPVSGPPPLALRIQHIYLDEGRFMVGSTLNRPDSQFLTSEPGTDEWDYALDNGGELKLGFYQDLVVYKIITDASGHETDRQVATYWVVVENQNRQINDIRNGFH